MIINEKSPYEKRAAFRKALAEGKLLRFPGATSPLVAKMIQEIGYDGIYVSGAVMSNDLGFPDVGLTTLTEVGQRASQIARVTDLPTIMDVDTGFGETLNIYRTIKEVEYLGLSGCHLEDQLNPKRCGHLDHKQLLSTIEMCKKVRAAAEAKSDENFIIIARTDARSVESLEQALDRAKAYVDAGAEMIFPEALVNEKEFELFRKEIDVPLLANMTEFGKSELLSVTQLEDLGYNLVIYPVTTQRLAMRAIEEGLKKIFEEGTQEGVLERMQTRKELYDVLDYEGYNRFDKELFNFQLNDKQ